MNTSLRPGTAAPPQAMLIAVPTTPDTSPPKSPWTLALNKLKSGVAVMAPTILLFIVDPVVIYLSQQKLALPDAYKEWQPLLAIVLTGAVLAYQTTRKAAREQERKDAGELLKALGVPVGVPMTADKARAYR